MRAFSQYAENRGQGAKAPPGGKRLSRARGGVAVALVACTLAACASDDGSREAGDWAGPRVRASTASVDVAEFNRIAEREEAEWERSPLLTAIEFAGAEDADAASTTAELRGEGEARERAAATITLAGLRDDSVHARRYEIELTRSEDGTWRVEAATWAQRCAAGRGHASFSPEPCL